VIRSVVPFMFFPPDLLALGLVPRLWAGLSIFLIARGLAPSLLQKKKKKKNQNILRGPGTILRNPKNHKPPDSGMPIYKMIRTTIISYQLQCIKLFTTPRSCTSRLPSEDFHLRSSYRAGFRHSRIPNASAVDTDFYCNCNTPGN
jgi:hypothetical protein